MATLLQRMRAARETWFEVVPARALLLRRPAAVELSRWRGLDDRAVLAKAIVGWRGFVEQDLVPGGDITGVPFDIDVALEWLDERPQCFMAVCAELNRLLEADRTFKDEQEKK